MRRQAKATASDAGSEAVNRREVTDRQRAAHLDPFVFEDYKLTTRRRPTYREWKEKGPTLGQFVRSSNWWIGDWMNIGEDLFGDLAMQALDTTGVSLETLQQYARIARQVPPHRRVDTLSWSHHREVADLPPREQSKWLGRVEASASEGQPWSVTRLRQELQQQPHARPSIVAQLWVQVSCKNPADVDALIERMSAEGRSCRRVERHE